jgi:hypothetical protein
MDTVAASLEHMRALLGSGRFAWPTREFGTPIPELPDWTGTVSDKAHTTSGLLDSRREALGAAHTAVAPIIEQANQVADHARQRIDAIRAQWQTEKAALEPFSSTPAGAAALVQLGEIRVGEGSQVLTQAQSAFTELAGQIHAVAARLPSGLGGGAPLSPPPQAVPAWGSPLDDVKKWWDSKSRQDKDALIREHPDQIGNLDGIPAEDRDAANQTMMNQDLRKVESVASEHHASIEDVTAHPQEYGLNQRDISRYGNAVKVKDGLEHNTIQTGTDTFLLIYKPEAFNGQGRAALAIGDPDKAANVAVTVPGTSHSVAEGWLSANDSSNLYNQMKSSSSEPNSVIAWMGYDAPDGFSDARIASTPLAHEGAGLLNFDVTGFKSTNEGAHYTVIGHSYGSTVVADAAWARMPADDIVLIGSPGTDMARTAADFHLPAGGQVYVGAASTDPITQLGKVPTIPAPGTVATIGLGPDPSVDGFGSVRFKAEVPGITFNDHSHYYQPGTESLRSIGLISSGQGAALQSHGLTAPPRGNVADQILGTLLTGPAGAVNDLELPRIPGQ